MLVVGLVKLNGSFKYFLPLGKIKLPNVELLLLIIKSDVTKFSLKLLDSSCFAVIYTSPAPLIVTTLLLILIILLLFIELPSLSET